MPSTRHSQTGEFAPEAKLSSSALRGINIGTNIVARVASTRDQRTASAMMWLAAYATLRKTTADSLSAELDLDKASIRAALCDPDYEDIARFVERVEHRRARFESDLPTPAKTEVAQIVSKACRFALAERAIVEVVGKTRMGKTWCAEPTWLRNLNSVAYFECPSSDDERTFIFQLARAVGIPAGPGTKAGQVRPRLLDLFHSGHIKLLIVDEGHRLWPSDVRAKPKRIEFLREIFRDGRGCSVLILATPQHTESLHKSLDEAGRWSPGQYEGRVVRYHLKDTMSDVDLTTVALHHTPELTAEMVDLLVTQAKASEGYCGMMVNTLRLARFEADGRAITMADLKAAVRQMMQSTRAAQVGAKLSPVAKAA